MMLRELYLIGQTMKDGVDWPIAMYEERKVRWEIWLDEDGMLRPSGVKLFDTKNEPTVVQGPDRPNNKVACLILDNPEYTLGVGKNGVRNHKLYMETLEKCVNDTGNRAARTLLAYLRDHVNELIDEMSKLGFEKKQLTTDSESNNEATNWINFKVGDHYPIDSPDIIKWWGGFARNELDTIATCCISGSSGKITRKFPVSVKLNGKNCKLASVDSPAHKSYGFDKTDHAPMSHEAALIAGTALKQLLRDDRYYRRFDDTYYAFWTRDHTMRSGLTAMMWGANQDSATASEVRALFDSVFKGRQQFAREDKFYMFVATNTETRVVIRASFEQALGKVIDSVHDWFESIQLCGPGPEFMVIKALHDSVQASNKRRNRSIGLSLIKRALFGIPLPRTIYTLVFPRLESTIRKGDRRGNKKPPQWRCPMKEQVTIIKLYLSQQNPEVKNLVVLKEDFPDIAYHYGRLMAVYEDIQINASPNVQSTLTERFFSSMMINPKRTIAKIDVLSRLHIRKVARDKGRGFAVNYSRRLQSINNEISAQGAAECNTLSLDQRGLFVLGYWHEKFRTFNPKMEGKETDDDTGSEDTQQDK